MFGTWRTLLAIEVVVSHILFVPILGGYAVFSFFVLSGFLMTSIMHTTYGYTPGGFVRYAANRALRLYPNYWFAIMISLGVILLVGAPVATKHFAAFTTPQTSAEWLQNLTMIFPYLVPSDARSILAPPTWALTVEICYYILIGLGVSQSKRSTVIWFALSIAYLVIVRQFHADNRYSYAAIPAGSLPFSVGALTWHYRADLQRVRARMKLGDERILIVLRWIAFLVALAIFWKTGWQSVTMAALWLNVTLSCLIVGALADVEAPKARRRIDKAIGDFSYPIYLLHMQMGVVASVLLFGMHMPKLRSVEGIAVLALTLVLTGLLTLVCARIIDPAIERRRTGIRQRAITAGTT
jgi:peptidoglycan/LPS O-acetylase OafA/YrhL